MDKRAWKNFLTKRSTIWTASLCMAGILVLGGITAADRSRRQQKETEHEIGQVAYLEEEIPESGKDIEDELFPTLDRKAGEETENLKEETAGAAGETAQTEISQPEDPGQAAEQAAGTAVSDSREEAGQTAEEGQEADASREASSGTVISEQALAGAGVNFTDAQVLLWPAAGSILIDYKMDGSVYFRTLNQYKYNPALIIGSAAGNQVLASAKGIVESITTTEETGTTLVLNIGNGYRLTYGQLKEITASPGDVVEEGEVLGYISEPTRYYSKEGSNLYFEMTKDGTPVDPVLYLE